MPRYIDTEKCLPKIIDLLETEWGYEGIDEDVKEIFDTIPAAGVAPVVHAYWKTWEEQFPDRELKPKYKLGVFCSACSLYADNHTDYCPNCGARMDRG